MREYYYGLVLKTTVFMFLTVFLIMMMVVVVVVVMVNVTERLFWGRHVYCEKRCYWYVT